MKRSGSKGQTAFARRIAVLAAAAALCPSVVAADAIDLFYERSFMVAADARCGLFRDSAALALAAAAHQARGAALRQGIDAPDLARTAARARVRARATPCASPDLAVAAGRVRHAFDGWMRTRRMSFPGAKAEWAVDRTDYSRPAWRLVQHSRSGGAPVAFGKAGGPDGDQILAVVSFPGRSRPYAARLVMRNPEASPRPWLAGQTPSTRLPPSARRVIWASGSGEAAPTLLGAGARHGDAWRFPAAAADALSQLDPREGFTLEFLFRDDTVARAHFEAGDLAAARAFLAMGRL